MSHLVDGNDLGRFSGGGKGMQRSGKIKHVQEKIPVRAREVF